jgi:GNAT superfamily N-acetyltransferase
MRVAAERSLDPREVVELYDSVGWTAYTRDPDRLMRGLYGSHLVLTARDDDGVLIGLARTISDGETVCYLQDLLVRPDQQRAGVGRRLMEHVLESYVDCRTLLLSTDGAADDTARRVHAFYRSAGLVPIGEQGLVAFART